eukprot:2725919-Pleurochrysis_carterae.AAC.2
MGGRVHGTPQIRSLQSNPGNCLLQSDVRPHAGAAPVGLIEDAEFDISGWCVHTGIAYGDFGFEELAKMAKVNTTLLSMKTGEYQHMQALDFITT